MELVEIRSQELLNHNIELKFVDCDGEKFLQASTVFKIRDKTYGAIVYADYIDRNYYVLLDLIENLRNPLPVSENHRFSNSMSDGYYRQNIKLQVPYLEAANELVYELAMSMVNGLNNLINEARKQGLSEIMQKRKEIQIN